MAVVIRQMSRSNREGVHVTEEIDVKNGSRLYFGLMQQGGNLMPRPLQRVRLESGLKLNLNSLARRGFIKPGAITGPVGIAWTDDTGQEIASGYITADLSDEHGGWLRIRLGQLDQCIYLVARPRHFGGRQWFFMCPHLHSRATVLWMPPGAHSFACRERWRRQVAYASQFMDRTARAHQGKRSEERRVGKEC